VETLELQINKLRSRNQPTPEIDGTALSADAASPAVVAEAKINYLKTMIMTLMNELNSITEDGREPARRRIDLKAEVLRFESELIRSALQTTRGQQRRAARLLGTNATTLNTKLKRLKIGIDDDPSDSCALNHANDIGFTDDDGRSLTFAQAMDRYEVSLIRNALMHTGGNQSRAARLLQIPITTLNSKIKKLGIDVARYAVNFTTDLPSLGLTQSSFEPHSPNGLAR
jgi:DNA-binding NtrC family response regulator